MRRLDENRRGRVSLPDCILQRVAHTGFLVRDVTVSSAAVYQVCFLFEALTGEDTEASSGFSPEAKYAKAPDGSHVSMPTVTGNTVHGNINNSHNHYHGKKKTLDSTVNDLLMSWFEC